MAFLLPPIMPISKLDRELSLQHIVDYLDSVLAEDAGSLGRDSFQLRNPIDDLGSMAFYLTYYGVNVRPLREKLAAVAVKGHPQLVYQAAHCTAPGHLPSGNGLDRPRLEIGIASKSFYDHSTGKWMLGMIRDLDRSKFRVTVVLIPPIHDDSLTPKIRDAADQVVVPTADLDGVRETIAGLQLDILVLADVGMDTTLYATAFARLAPVQVGIAAAWPVTTGVPTLDYMASFDVVCCLTLTYSRQPLAGWLAGWLARPCLAPEGDLTHSAAAFIHLQEIGAAQEHYSEKLIRLPGILPYADPVPQELAREMQRLHWNDPQQLQALTALRSELGLPRPGKKTCVCANFI